MDIHHTLHTHQLTYHEGGCAYICTSVCSITCVRPERTCVIAVSTHMHACSAPSHTGYCYRGTASCACLGDPYRLRTSSALPMQEAHRHTPLPRDVCTHHTCSCTCTCAQSQRLCMHSPGRELQCSCATCPKLPSDQAAAHHTHYHTLHSLCSTRA